MFVVVFEVRPHPQRWDDYVGTAGILRPDLERIDGFIDNDRYRNVNDASGILSLSTWRDEKSVIRWRTQERHHLEGQTRGRDGILGDYRLRVGEVMADSGAPATATLAQHRFDETEVEVARTLSITEIGLNDSPDDLGFRESNGLVGITHYVHLDHATRYVVLASWRTAECCPMVPPGRCQRHRKVRIIRAYGLRDRREAPQWFPTVP